MKEDKLYSLFEFNINCGMLNYKSYENMLNDIFRLCSLVVIYYLFSNKNIGNNYLFDNHNVILLFIGIISYHLIFQRLLVINFDKKEVM